MSGIKTVAERLVAEFKRVLPRQRKTHASAALGRAWIELQQSELVAIVVDACAVDPIGRTCTMTEQPQTTLDACGSREDHARSLAQRLRERADRTQAHINQRRGSRFMSEQTISNLQAEVEADGAAAIYLEIAVAKGALA